MFGRKKWEYRVEFLHLETTFDCEKRFDVLGESGWELVSVQLNTESELAFFKRRV